MNKKTEQITIHVTQDQKAVFLALAELEGMTASELGSQVVNDFISAKFSVYQTMRKVFDSKEIS